MAWQESGPEAGGGDVLQLIVDQVEELLVTLLEEVRARPSVAVALLAAVLAAWAGLALANRGARRKPRLTPPAARAGWVGSLLGALAGAGPVDRGREVSERVTKSARGAAKRSGGLRRGLGGAASAGELVALGVRLLENPIVRAYLRRVLASQLRKRFRSR